MINKFFTLLSFGIPEASLRMIPASVTPQYLSVFAVCSPDAFYFSQMFQKFHNTMHRNSVGSEGTLNLAC